MNYKSIFNVVSTNNFFKGGDVNRNTLFKNAAMLCVLVLVSIGCGDSSAQSSNNDERRLIGAWVNIMDDGKDGATYLFNSDGTVAITSDDGTTTYKYGAVAGKIIILGLRSFGIDQSHTGRRVGDFFISNDGKTLLIIANHDRNSHLFRKK
jgi:hypothetical protein